MKKYLLKGKQLLSKKLQQFDIEPVTIDYVAQQTPTRLKQCLSVLRDNQIDLQDNQLYQTYFKNYPNHHISHYLLDKVKQFDQQLEKQQHYGHNQYDVPSNLSSYIPPFDQKLQAKALGFKQAIQQYSEGYNVIQQPLVCICVIHFHHKRGTQIQYMYPTDNKNAKFSQNIIHHAMPDSSHLRNQDCNFFNFQSDYFGKKRMLFGISYFKQIKVTEQHKKNNVQLTRSHVQKAIAVVSTLPLFQQIKSWLQSTTQIFFYDFNNFAIIKEAFIKINKNLFETWPNMQLLDLYLGCDIKKMLNKLGPANLYDLWKALLYQKRIVVFAQTSSDASSFILSLLSLFPGLSTFGLCSKPISRYLQSLRQYALPLRIFSSQNFLSISFHVQDFWQLSKFAKQSEGSFLLGTTNKLLKQSNQYGIQMLVNLQDGTIIKNKPRRPWQPLSKKQKNFVMDLKSLLQNQENGQQIHDNSIRNMFHQFLKNALSQMILSIKQYQTFTDLCAKYQKSRKKGEKEQPKKFKSYQLMEDEADESPVSNDSLDYAPTFPVSTYQMILPQLLLNKSFAYFRQFHNNNLAQIINGKILPSIQIKNYDYFYRINSQDFINYNWVQKKLTFGKGTPQNLDGKQLKLKTNQNLQIQKINNKQQIKSVYIGMIQDSKYTKNGFYVDQLEYYEGQFKNGLKHGYGKFTNTNQKYIGNFVNNLYEGDGQLVKQGQVYLGAFKYGFKHGFGSIQGTQNMSGYWVKNQFYYQSQTPPVSKQQRKSSTVNEIN